MGLELGIGGWGDIYIYIYYKRKFCTFQFLISKESSPGAKLNCCIYKVILMDKPSESSQKIPTVVLKS